MNKPKGGNKIASKALLSVGALALAMALPLLGCQPSTTSGKNTIVVTYSILGSVVQELVGDEAIVIVPVPNGQDPHDWEPSARDIETINKADLVIENGLGLEGGLEKTLGAARDRGVQFFTASDHIEVRRVKEGEGIPTGDPDQAVGAEDPHFWTDPLAMKAVVEALVPLLKQDLDMDVSGQAQALEGRLDGLNSEVASTVSSVPEENRKLVTGHESMGYFAQRFGFKLTGVIIPSLSSQAGVSAADLAELKIAIEQNNVKAIFSELGTPAAITKAISDETNVRVVELTTHALPADGSYFTFVKNMAATVTNALK